MERSSRQIGLLLLLLGAVLFSSKAIFIKLAYQYEVSSISLLGLRMSFSLPLFLLIGFFRKDKHAQQERITPRQVVAIGFIGCAGYYGASYLDFLGLNYMSAGMERLILFVYPTMVLVLQRLFFNIPIRPVQWLATGVCYLGVLVAFSSSDLSIGSGFRYGALLVFASAFLYSWFVIGSGNLAPKIGSIRFTSTALTVAACCVLTHVYLSGEPLLGLHPQLYVYGATLAVFCTVIPSYLVTEGIRRLGAGDAAIIGAVGPVATIVLEYFVLGEVMNVRQALGAVLIIVGVVIIGRSKS